MTPILLRIAVASSLALASLALAIPSSADVKYTLTMSMQGGNAGAMAPNISTTNYYQSNRYRTDVSMHIGTFMSKDAEIVGDCSDHKVYTMDPDLQIYYVSDMGSTAPDMFGMGNLRGMFGGMGQMGRPPAPVTATKTVTETFKVLDDGMDAAVGGHHYTITITSTGEDRPTPPVNMDVWIDQTKFTYPCIDRFSGMKMPETTTASGTTYVMAGDVDKMRDVMGGGVPVKISVVTERGAITFERSNLSTDSLDDSLFSPPASFKEVNQDQYDAQEQQAMMKHFQNMGGGRPGGPPAAQ